MIISMVMHRKMCGGRMCVELAERVREGGKQAFSNFLEIRLSGFQEEKTSIKVLHEPSRSVTSRTAHIQTHQRVHHTD
jgi:hypothetical protein